MTEPDDLAAPVFLRGDEARQFTEWMASEPRAEVQSALEAALQAGRRLLEGSSLSLKSGLVLRYVAIHGRCHTVGHQSGSDEVHHGVRVRARAPVDDGASESICETCGNPVQLRDLGGWLVTLCEPHLGERMPKRPKRSL